MFFPEIVSMHFQLTGRCNLKCIFCGQQNGMFEGKNREELPYEKWIAIAEEVRNLGSRPEIILWGGEPLLYSRFDELAEHLHRMGFELGIVTNGTLADRHADLLNNAFKTIYISLDGNAEYHNRIRGNGVFEKVSDNLELLKKRNGHLVFLCTLADENASAATEIAECLSVDQSLISKFESGERSINSTQIDTICNIVCYPEDKLMDEKQDIRPDNTVSFRTANLSIESIKALSVINRIFLNQMKMDKWGAVDD